jgi:hypothetical protein
MAGSLLGGWVSDRRAAVDGAPATARVEFVGPAGLLVLPVGMVLFGWVGNSSSSGLIGDSSNSNAVIALSLLGAAVVCWAGSSVLPAVYTYTTTKVQSHASAAAALLAAVSAIRCH